MRIYGESIVLSAVATLLLTAGAAQAGPARELSFPERVAAQEAIERLYYSYQVGATMLFEEAVPREVLRRKVRRYLRQSAALKQIWHSPVTAEMLRAEWQRIAGATRLPDRLRALYLALDEDPVLIQECFVHQVLVDRLARGFLAFDPITQAAAREEARSLAERLHRSPGLLEAADPRRRVTRMIAGDEGGLYNKRAGGANGESVRTFTSAELDPVRGRLGARPWGIGPVEESRHAFTLRALLEDEPDHLLVATYTIPKTSWDQWWAAVRHRFDGVPVSAVATEEIEFAPPEVCIADDVWDNGALDDFPAGRDGHTAVWTGSLMVIWGGDRLAGLDTGGRYDPLTDTWTLATTVDAPAARFDHTAVWTGSEMIVWGGSVPDSPFVLDTGGRYDPIADTWTPLSTSGAPAARRAHAATWAGDRMFIWGGASVAGVTSTGGLYDPGTDSWSATSSTDAPPRAENPSVVWTGSQVVVWGGDYNGWLDSGGRYDPATDIWSPTTTVDAPAARHLHTATWTGTRMLVWGGPGSCCIGTGGSYDPVADAWTAISTVGAPSKRSYHTASWTGDRMIVWGGTANPGSGSAETDTGGLYDPVTDSWTPTSTAGAPQPRERHTAVWTGDRLLIWGGNDNLETGGRYDPATDSWTPTSTGGAPVIRLDPSAVWTGTEMIVWGGWQGEFVNTGGRYDPLTDAWTATATAGAPVPRSGPTAVWTGGEMVVWGGSDGGLVAFDTGGRYDPSTDSWIATNTEGAPTARRRHSAIWTGRRMVVWGGTGSIPLEATETGGGLYDPARDVWEPMTTAGEPAGRSRHAVAWSGDEMIVWGGYDATFLEFSSGGRYDPVADTWVPTSNIGAPSPRSHLTAIWTGSEMINWGGVIDGVEVGSGGRYDPATDTWSATPSTDAPSAREGHSAVWTGNEMIVWGGNTGAEIGEWNSGARFDPASGTWTATSSVAAPAGRQDHVAVWTGGFMIIWGGDAFPGSGGGRYAIGQSADVDGDGTTYCGGDCDDMNPLTHPGATEICDGKDNDCDGTLAPFEADADSDGFASCEECDDGNAARFPGNPEICDSVDNDCDGIDDEFATACGLGVCAAVGFCSAGVDSCAPGAPAPESCDGLDNDCDGSVPADESDQDGDGFRICDEDCDDSVATIHAGAPEINDGLDNQCTGDPGFGQVDEVAGPISFVAGGGAPAFCWTAQPAAAEYEALRSGLPAFTSGCEWTATAGTCWDDGHAPPDGNVSYYLVRATEAFPGTFGLQSDAVERADLCGVERICTDGADDDGDGLVDCGDLLDCFGRDSCTATFSFTDTAQDDVVPTALQDLFALVPATATDFIRFTISGPTVTDFEWCAERADFYVGQYLALAAASGVAQSGSWDKWHRTEGGSWIGPDATGYDNLFGNSCVGPYSWCAEFGIAGHLLAVAPDEPGACELFDNITCSDGSWSLTIHVAPDRLAACGF